MALELEQPPLQAAVLYLFYKSLVAILQALSKETEILIKVLQAYTERYGLWRNVSRDAPPLLLRYEQRARRIFWPKKSLSGMNADEPLSEFECEGMDTDGCAYTTKAAMWESALVDDRATRASSTSGTDKSNWYRKSTSYWSTQEATLVGMLGGLDKLSDRDLRMSEAFLDLLQRRHGLKTGEDCHCVDVGAGIGRITKSLLLPRFGAVDMLEQNALYLQESVSYIGSSTLGSGVVERRMPVGMQDFSVVDAETGASSRERWNLVWIQWVIIYLTDDDFVSFIRKLLQCLAAGGIICVKDNIAPRGKKNGFVFDKSDSSIMRGDKYMKALFAKAGVVVVSEAVQHDFPSDTFPVKAYALISASDDRAVGNKRPTKRQAAASNNVPSSSSKLENLDLDHRCED